MSMKALLINKTISAPRILFEMTGGLSTIFRYKLTLKDNETKLSIEVYYIFLVFIQLVFFFLEIITIASGFLKKEEN